MVFTINATVGHGNCHGLFFSYYSSMISQIPYVWLHTSFVLSLLCTAGLVVSLSSLSRHHGLSRFSWWAACGISIFLLLGYHISDEYTGNGFTEGTWYQLQFGWAGLTWGLVESVVIKICFAAAGVFLLVCLIRKHIMIPAPAAKWQWLLLLGALAGPGSWQIGLNIVVSALQPTFVKDLENDLVVPSITLSTQPRSVVYIYAESLEDAWSEDSTLTPNLNKLSKDAMQWTGMHQAPFTGWTIAGIIASQCGFPALGSNTPQREVGSKSMWCLGDILKSYGYDLTYMNGADIRFAGKNLFFLEHGFDHVSGKQELLKKLPPTPRFLSGVCTTMICFLSQKKS